MKKSVAVVLAGGSGKRFGANRPKQFLMVNGKTILAHSVEVFEHHPRIDEVVIVSHADWVADVERLCKASAWTKVRHIVAGGRERYDSSLAALRLYEGQDVDLLLHDAVRPLLTAEVVDRVCEALQSHRAVGVAMPVVDTIVKADKAQIVETPSRSELYRMQTPQAFDAATLAEAYRRGLADTHFSPTDDCGVVVRYMPEVAVHLVEGEESNLKLTYAEDLPILEHHFAKRNDNNGEQSAALEALRADRDALAKRYAKRNLRAMQLKMLDILREVTALCDSHHIDYWLDSGTLLGAVRHGGFIPWDDDIDICVRLTDMPRLVAAAQRELPPHLFVQTPETDPQVRMPMCKVRDLNSFIVEGADDFSKNYAKGIYIDIFPMTEWPSFGSKFSKKVARGYCRANAILHAQHCYSWRSVAELFYFGAKRAICNLLWKVGGLFCRKDEYFSNTLNNSGNGNRHRTDTIFPLSTIEFEGETFKAPHDVDRYLKDLFNNYMQLPPENQREVHAVVYCVELEKIE